MIWTIVATVLATGLVIVLALNFATPEKNSSAAPTPLPGADRSSGAR